MKQSSFLCSATITCQDGLAASWDPKLAETFGASEVRAGDSLLVSVNLANTGSRTGAEVVQVYVAAPTEAGEPPRQLKAFTKVSVCPNQVQHLTVKLDPRAFSIWDKSKNRWTIVPGRYGLFVGTSSQDLLLHGSVLVHR